MSTTGPWPVGERVGAHGLSRRPETANVVPFVKGSVTAPSSEANTDERLSVQLSGATARLIQLGPQFELFGARGGT